jgi:hypothetical protein
MGPPAPPLRSADAQAAWTCTDATLRLDVEDLLPIAGGAPDEPYEPSPEDLADYTSWSESLGRIAEVRRWLDANQDSRPTAQCLPLSPV